MAPHRRRGLLVSIFGPDGAGKTTHADLVAKHLASKGFKVKRAWVKSYHTLAYVLSKLYAKLSPRSVELNAYGNIIGIHPLRRGRFSKKLWAWLECLSILPKALLSVIMPVKAGCIVVADRYVLDSIASIAYTLRRPDFAESLPARLLLALIPTGSVLIYVDAPSHEIARRRGRLADPEGYLEAFRSTCRELARRLNAPTIDTSRLSVEQAHGLIVKLVDEVVDAGLNSRPHKRT